MAKFKAGDMIIGSFTRDDGEAFIEVYMVNRDAFVDPRYVNSPLHAATEWYSLDNGDGFADARATVRSIDADFELCSDVDKRNAK